MGKPDFEKMAENIQFVTDRLDIADALRAAYEAGRVDFTTGHVDAAVTAIIQALTPADLVRLLEEKAPGCRVEFPTGEYACHADCDVGEEPLDDCVLDYCAPHKCIYAKNIKRREECKYWKRKLAAAPSLKDQTND